MIADCHRITQKVLFVLPELLYWVLKLFPKPAKPVPGGTGPIPAWACIQSQEARRKEILGICTVVVPRDPHHLCRIVIV